MIDSVQSARIDVVVKSYKRYCKYKTDHSVSKTLVVNCKNILLNSELIGNSTVCLTSDKLAKIYGITNVVVHDLRTKNDFVIPRGKVSDLTKFTILSVHSDDFYQFSLDAECPNLGGLDQELRKLERLFDINKSSRSVYHPLGVLLHGPPGCGKTSFGKVLSKMCDAAFYNVEVSSFLTSDFGSGAALVRETFKKAILLREEGPVILFLDEIDTMCPKSETASLGNKQLINALINEMDSLHTNGVTGLLVLAATNSISSIDLRLRRPGRFDQEILINVPTESQRLSILEILTADLNLSTNISCATLAKMTPGFVGADLGSLCEEAINHKEQKMQHEIDMEDFKAALYTTMPSLKKGSECVVELKPVMWSDIGSLDTVKAEIKQSIEWPLMYPDVLQKMDIPPPKGILLYGPPGCCKTTLVRAAATSCNVSFLALSGAQVFSAYVGESEKLISEAFQKARALAPSILFLDEIESIVGKRRSDTGNSRVQERILSTMLNEMDGVGNRLDFKLDASSAQEANPHQKSHRNDSNIESADTEQHSPSSNLRVVVVGATNRPDMLDAAIMRPGRLDKHIYVPPPNLQARKAILEIYLSKMSCSGMDVDCLAEKTELCSGADLKNLCKEAGLLAMRESLSLAAGGASRLEVTISQQNFDEALNKVKSSLTKELLQAYAK